MFSDRKLVRIDHKMSDEQFHYVEVIWPVDTKIVPFDVPPWVETETVKVAEQKEEVVTVLMVKQMLQSQSKSSSRRCRRSSTTLSLK